MLGRLTAQLAKEFIRAQNAIPRRFCRNKPYIAKKISAVPLAVSLFSNCGAGDVGYQNASFSFEVMAELEPKRLDVCLNNHKDAWGVPGDLRTTWHSVVAAWRSRHGAARPDLLCACPPCQGMSSARAGMGSGQDPLNGSLDARNLLVEVVAETVCALRPRMVVLENVPQFLSRLVVHPKTEKGVTAPGLLLERIGAEYAAFPVVLDMADYGVPQTRKRTFITLIRKDEPCLALLLEHGRVPFPMPTHEGNNRVSFTQHLEKFTLPALSARTAVEAVDPNDPLHAVPVWNRGLGDTRYAMTVATAFNGGSAWDNKACSQGCDNSNVEIEADAAICPNCSNPLLRPVIKDKETGAWRLISGFHSSSYRRMDGGAVAPTITTASGHIGSDINIHPTQHRLLSVRECALLQTFPWSFEWGDALTKRHLGKIREMIGEAVPPKFTEAHGEVLAALLNGQVTPADLMPADNVRSKRARTKLWPATITQLSF